MTRKLGFGVVVSAALALAGCTNDFYDSRVRGFTPEYPDRTYPIEVKTGEARLRIPLRRGRLTPAERIRVRRFAAQAVSLPETIRIIRPAGSLKGEVLAAEVTKELIRAGIEAARIVHVRGKVHGVVLSMRRKVAVTKKCGDWSRPLNETTRNRVYPDLGCSQQHNLAAMVDNPGDFERPRVMSPPDADARNAAMGKYRKLEDHSATWPGDRKIRIDNPVAESAKSDS